MNSYCHRLNPTGPDGKWPRMPPVGFDGVRAGSEWSYAAQKGIHWQALSAYMTVSVVDIYLR